MYRRQTTLYLFSSSGRLLISSLCASTQTPTLLPTTAITKNTIIVSLLTAAQSRFITSFFSSSHLFYCRNNNIKVNNIQSYLHRVSVSSSSSSSSMSSSTTQTLSLEEIRTLLTASDDIECGCEGKLDLVLDDESGIARLCINHPARKNAFSGRMMAQFSDRLSELERWKEGRAVIIYGADRFFCSGADLNTVRQGLSSSRATATTTTTSNNNPSGAYCISTLMHDNLRRLEQLPLISVALVEGKAIGGGAELITACDIRVCTATAQIGFVHARLGVTPGFGGGVRLIRLIGQTAALQMMLSAKPIGGEQARQIGLIQHVLPASQSSSLQNVTSSTNTNENTTTTSALDATIEWYRATYGTISVYASRRIKSIINATNQVVRGEPEQEALRQEANVFQQVWGSEEHKRALAANIKHH